MKTKLNRNFRDNQDQSREFKVKVGLKSNLNRMKPKNWLDLELSKLPLLAQYSIIKKVNSINHFQSAKTKVLITKKSIR